MRLSTSIAGATRWGWLRTLSLCGGALLALPAAEDPLPFDAMAPTVGEILENHYYDAGRIRPKVMVERALRRLELSEPSVNTTWEGDRLIIDFAGEPVSVKAVEPQDIAQAMAIIESVRLMLPKGGFDAQTTRDLTYSMLNGALSSLDPHTGILPPMPASDFAEDIRGEFHGVGAYLNSTDGVISIERVMADLPAERAGIKDGDVILGINGEPTVGMSLPQAVRRIKGPKGTPVVLRVEREGEAEPLDIEVIRDLIPVPDMVSWYKDGVGYVRMDEFNQLTARNLYASIARMHLEKGPLKGFVLDLRFNGGGLLRQAHEISDFFLPPGKEIVRTVALGGKPDKYLSGRLLVLESPMVILTAPGSASASEILAGALQINDRAVVVGATTFGKGSVQTIRELKDESHLKLTIQEYQLSDGVSIQEKGVVPDLKLLRQFVAEDGSVDLVPYTYQREVDQEFSLKSGGYRHESSLNLFWTQHEETLEESKTHRISAREFHPDQEATLVVELLRDAIASVPETTFNDAWTESRMRQVTIEALRGAVEARATIEAEQLDKVLAEGELGLRWGGDAPIATDQLTATYTGPKTVQAGTTADLSFSITNTGDQDAGRLYGLIQAEGSSPLWEQEIIIGAIPTKATVERSVQFDVPERAFSGEDRVTLEIRQAGVSDQLLVKVPVELSVAEIPRPHLSYSWAFPEDLSGGLQRDTVYDMVFTIKNTGEAASKDIRLNVFKDDDPFVQLGAGRFKLDPIEPGEEVTAVVPVSTTSSLPQGMRSRPQPNQVVLQIRAEEDFPAGHNDSNRVGFFHRLELPIADGDQAADVVKGPHSIHPAKIRILAAEQDQGALKLVYNISDDNPKYLSVFRDDEKVILKPLPSASTDIELVSSVDLEPGFNDIRIIVSDADEVLSSVGHRVWNDAAPKVAAEGINDPDDGEVLQ